MNAILILKRLMLLLTVILLCLSCCSCQGQTSYEWQADRDAEGEFLFAASDEEDAALYVLNVAAGRIHKKDCRYVEKIKEENRLFVKDLYQAKAEEYRCCSACFANENIE